MLYTLFMIGLAPVAAIPAAGLQALILGASAFLLYCRSASIELPERARRHRPLILATLALVTLSTLFPPVTRPWWVPGAARGGTDAATPLPIVAFIGDARFDASRHFPLFAVDRRALVVEWVALAVAALAVSQVALRRRDRAKPEVGAAP